MKRVPSIYTIGMLLLLSVFASAEPAPDLSLIKLGMSPTQVQAAIGGPIYHEAFLSVRNSEIKVLFYPGDIDLRNGTRAISPIPLIFENGKLVGYGNSFYQKKLDTYLPSPTKKKATP